MQSQIQQEEIGRDAATLDKNLIDVAQRFDDFQPRVLIQEESQTLTIESYARNNENPNQRPLPDQEI